MDEYDICGVRLDGTTEPLTGGYLAEGYAYNAAIALTIETGTSGNPSGFVRLELRKNGIPIPEYRNDRWLVV